MGRKRKHHGPHDPVDWSKYADRLGTVSDQVIATEAGTTRERVRQVRNVMGIGARRDSKRKEREDAFELAVTSLSTDAVAQLGKVTDVSLAGTFAVHVEVIREARERAGIPRFLLGCGTYRAYVRGCRCPACTACNRKRVYAWQKANPEKWAVNKETRRTTVLESAPHSRKKATVSMYVLGCRCDGCRHAASKYYKEKREQLATKVVTSPATT